MNCKGRKISELDLIKLVKPKLKSLFKNFEIYEEVGLFNRNIDMVILSGEIIHSIEFKLHDWRKALEQAEDYRLASDYSYICMPERKVSETFKSPLIKNGIGLILYNKKDDKIKTVVSPVLSNKKINFYKKQLVSKILSNKDLYQDLY